MPLNIESFGYELRNYTDSDFVHKCIEVFIKSFSPVYASSPLYLWSVKIFYQRQNIHIMLLILVYCELEKGYIIGPFVKPPFDWHRKRQIL